MKQHSSRASRGRLAVLALVAFGAFAGISASSAMAAPSIANTGTGCTTGQLAWLVSCTSTGEDGAQSNAKQLRISVLVNGDSVTKNSLASLLTDDDWDGTSDPSTVRTATVMSRPDIAGGYPRSRGSLQYSNPNADGDTGINSGTFCVGATRRTSGEFMRLQPRDTAASTGGTTSSGMRFTAAGQCSGAEDYAYLFSWDGAGVGFTCPTGNPSTKNNGYTTNFDPNRSITSGTDVRFCYRGDDPDTTGNSDFEGINWRLRNLRTGGTLGEHLSCPDNGDNDIKGVTVDFPERGSWVVEAELRDGGGCTQDQNPGYWFPIGTANVNSSAAPTGTLTADADTGTAGVQRPQFNGDVTAQATSLTDAAADENDTDDGGVQIIEWDLDGSTTDTTAAPDGYEMTTIAAAGSDLGTAENAPDAHNTTGESPGLHTIRMRLTDNGAMDAADTSRKRSEAITTTYLVDSAPTASNVGPLDTQVGQAVNFTMSGADTDPGDAANLTYTPSDPPHGTVTGTGATQTYTPDAGYAGTDSFTYTVTDAYGRTSSSATVSIGVFPNTSTTANPPNPSNDNTPDFQFTSNGSPVGFECRVDTGTFTSCSSPHTTAMLADGSHTFEVRAVTTNGSLADSTPASYTWVTDTVAPNTTIDESPPLVSNSPNAQFKFSSEPNATFQCRIDSIQEADFGACTSPKSYGLADGTHTFDVRAVDQAGNKDATPATYTWVILTGQPNTTIDDPKPANPTNQTSATFNFSSDRPNSTFECRLDSTQESAFQSCTSPKAYAGPLSDGSHTFEVRAIDLAGNVDGSPASHTWTVDTQGPTVTLDTFPNNPTNSSTASFSFHASEASSSFQCRLDNDPGGYTNCSSPQVYNGLGEGSHTFDVKGTDPAGNTGDPATYTWVVDQTPPNTLIDTSPNVLSNSTMASFTYHATESNATFECKLDTGIFAPCNSQPQTYSGLSQGSHTFQVRGTDAAGNTDQTPDSFTWTVDTIAPATSIDEGSTQWPPPGSDRPSHRTTSQNADFDFFANDPNATFECRLDSSLESDFQPCNTPRHYTGLTDGPHKFEVRARDLAGNVDQSPATWTWSVHSGLPDTILDSYPADPSNQTTATFTFHGTIDGSTFRCRLDDAPAGFTACTSPQSYPGLSAGTHKFEVIATDEFGRDDPTPTTYTWTIDLSAPDTVLDDKPLNPSNSSSASFTFHSTEPGSTLQCKLDSGSYATCDESMPQNYTNLGDGSHVFSVKATDPAGNEDPTPATYTWVIDTDAPETTIDQKPSNPSNINNPSFQFSSDEANSTFACRLDNAPAGFTPCSTNLQYNDLPEGSHTFEVQATDQAGNTDSSPASYTWDVDLTPPDTSIDDGPAGTTKQTTATFQFSSESNATFQCRLDSTQEADFQSCSSGQQYTNLGDGQHTFEVRAIDTAGNRDPSPASRTWTVDATPPDTTITAPTPANPTNSGAAVFTFTSSEPNSTFECELDGGGFSTCTSGTDFGPVGEGGHTFKVRATDAPGNTDQSPAEYTWTVDQTAPDTTIGQKPDNPTASSDAVFTFTSTEANSTFECKLDSGNFQPCTSGTNFGPVTEGGHTFLVKATDSAANIDPDPASYAWTVDQTAPETNITGQPNNPTASSNAVFDFNSSESNSTFECKLDTGISQPCTSGTDFGPVGEGSHTFQVRATDNVSNADASPASYTWTVDQTGPGTTIDTAPDNPTNSQSATFTFHANENNSTFECRLDDAPAGFTSCTSGVNYSVSEGSHKFEVKATDPSTNTGPVASHTWTVDATGPQLQFTNTQADPTNSTSATVEWSSNESAAYVCAIDNPNDTSSCDSGKAYSNLSEGSHTVYVTGTDTAGNPSTIQRTWVVDTTGPVVDITGGPNGLTNETTASFPFDVTGNPVDVECKLDTGTSVDCTSPAQYSSLGDGPHTVTVTATDAAGNPGSDSQAWTVDATAPDTDITGQPSNPTNETSGTFTFTSEAGATFECRLDGGSGPSARAITPGGDFAACSSGDTFTGLSPGSHTFEVRATDAADNTDQSPATYVWEIDTTAPTVDITGGPTGTTGQTSASFPFTTGGNPADVECQLDTGAFIDCTSPAEYLNLPDGPHTVTVNATDAAANSATDTQSWTVDTGPPDTTIDSGPNGTSGPSTQFGFSSNETSSTFECRLDSTNDADWQPCTSPRSLSGLAVGSHTFEVRATDVAANIDPTPAARTWTVAQQEVLGQGAGSPVIKKRLRALNVPGEGAFQIATITCRARTCNITKKEAKIKIGGATFNPPVTVEVVAKESADSLEKGEIAQVVVHFPLSVQKSLAENHFGQLVVKLAAKSSTGGSSAFKRIKLKAKFLKNLLG